jgi:ATP-dependent RNA helicase DeaD
MEKFAKLGLSRELTDVLKQHGFSEPSEIQEKTIPLALSGRDIIGGSATGSGKTLAFASAILENLKKSNEIQALILTPTRELAEQVATSIRNFGKNKKLNVLAVYGGVRIESQMRKLSTTNILVGTPGRILDHINRRSLRLDKVEFLVLDEVDRMFDMGFRKDVEKIINECPRERQTMMFSATISQDIDYLAKKYTKNPVEVSVNSYVDPSKLKQIYYDVPDYQKFSLLVSLLKKENADLVMVFCNTRRNVDFITDNLIRAGIHAKAIHGGIDQKKRMNVLDEFHKKGLGVLVCTDVAARGLDIKGVTHVYNYEVPTDPKDYIHRIGRTARAGKDGKAIIILASRDYENFRYMMRSGDLEIEQTDLPLIEPVGINMGSGRSKNKFIRGNKNVSRGRGFDKNPERVSRREEKEDRGFVRRSGGNSGARRSAGGRNSRGRSDSRSSSQRSGGRRSFSAKRRY